MAGQIISLIGIIISIVFFSWSIYKGLGLVPASLITSLIVIVTSGLNVMEAWNTGIGDAVIPMITGVCGVYIFGGLLGFMYSKSGAATAIAKTLFAPLRKIQNYTLKLVCYIVMMFVIRTLLAVAGIDAMAAMFILIGIIIMAFKDLDISRSYINCVLIAATTLTYYIPYIPYESNVWIPIFMDGFTAGSMAGVRCIIIVLFIIGTLFVLMRSISKDRKNGTCHFDPGNMEDFETEEEGKKYPNFFVTLIPLVIIIVLYNFFSFEAWLSTACGFVAAVILFYRNLDFSKEKDAEGRSKFSSFIEHCNTNSMIIPLYMAFAMLPGGIMTMTSGYQLIITLCERMVNVMPPALGFGIVSILISASGQSAFYVLIDLANQVFIPAGLTAGVAGTLVIVGSTVFDTLPNHPGMIMQAKLTDVPMKVCYPSIFKTTVILTTILTIVTAVLFTVGIAF